LAAAGLPVPDRMEGRPLMELDAREHVLTENDHQMVFTLRLRTLTTARWKLTRYEDRHDVGELYDLQEDPGEVVNRWADPAAAAVKRDLLAELDSTMNHKVDAAPM